MFVFLSHSGFLLSINWYAKTNNNLCNICPVVFAFVIGKSICEARAAKTKPRLLFGINRNARKIQGIRIQIEPKYTSANMAVQSVSKYNNSTWMHIIVPEYVFPLLQHMIAHYCSWICLSSITAHDCTLLCLISISCSSLFLNMSPLYLSRSWVQQERYRNIHLRNGKRCSRKTKNKF